MRAGFAGAGFKGVPSCFTTRYAAGWRHWCVARTKCKDSEVAGHANTFIFPDINAGNIGYKIAQRLGNFEAYGPILLGLNAPVNDLSRGCNAAEVYSMAIITAALA